MSLIDARFDALRTLGHTGSTSDMLYTWLAANGGVGDHINDRWRTMLGANIPRTDFENYHYNDWWYDLLGSQGYTGTLNDREYQFWLAGGVL
jgi:hypothetical protein